jgi:large subunit ribosomal protein L31
MKAGIHPNYKKSFVKCACGNEFESGSTLEEIKVEVCSECHPFYTGRQKFADAGGRVDRFNTKYKRK